MTPEEQLSRIHEHTEEFFAERRRYSNKELLPALEEEGIASSPTSKLRAAERRELRERFARDILPILTPLAIDPAHPFPHISNLSLNLLVVIEDEGRQGDGAHKGADHDRPFHAGCLRQEPRPRRDGRR